jgi:diaminohydroxyphosphoribosylaminopyrimidine deaminase/5-amino-6-(5-phosphoribosylamino)uracil reductase
VHAHFILRCLELAERGRGCVSPNPLVGCVITRETSDDRYQTSGNEEKIIAETWHGEFGGPHAEVLAITAATAEIRNSKNEIRKKKDLTLYVSLEPCSHHGKTPPCTEAIIKAGIKQVVFGACDPLHGGANVLRERGMEVIGPVLEAECRHLNRGFFSIVEQGRPWVTVKKAVPRECVALVRGRCIVDVPRIPRLKITSEEQDAWTHTRLRATHDAILVGSGTILADDPSLTIRCPLHSPSHPKPTHFQYVNILKVRPADHIPQPRRIILDPHGEVPKTAKVLTDEDAHRTLVIREKLPIRELLERLKDEGITSVLVEGGPRVWKAFEESGMYDALVILAGPPKTEFIEE